jgi:beta-phosphoglucomutase
MSDSLKSHHVKAIIFDCDGTLVDSEEAHISAWERTLQRRNHVLRKDQTHLYTGKTAAVIAKLLADAIGEDCAHELLVEKTSYYRELQKNGLPKIDHAVEFVHRISKEKDRYGLKLALASAGDTDEITRNLRSLGIDHLFDLVLSGEDDLNEYSDPQGVNKPKPYIYQHAAKLLNIKTHECVVIEDSLTGVSASHHAGCFTVAVPNRFTIQQDLTKAALSIETFSDITVDQFLRMVMSKK